MPADQDAYNAWINDFQKRTGQTVVRPPTFGGGGGGFSSGGMVSTSSTTPAYARVNAIPSWLPPSDMHELVDQYGKTGEMFGTGEYDAANQGQQSRVLTTALNAGNNAATEYANKARQAGGSGMGAGLIKAQSAVGGRKVAGDMELERQRFDASQREKAAGHAAQIATTLGQLRDSYLKTIVDYATKSDATSSEFTSKMAAVDAQNRQTDAASNANKPQGSWTGQIPNNMGLASGLKPFAVNATTGQYVTPPGGWTPGQSWNFGG